MMEPSARRSIPSGVSSRLMSWRPSACTATTRPCRCWRKARPTPAGSRQGDRNARIRRYPPPLVGPIPERSADGALRPTPNGYWWCTLPQIHQWAVAAERAGVRGEAAVDGTEGSRQLRSFAERLAIGIDLFMTVEKIERNRSKTLRRLRSICYQNYRTVDESGRPTVTLALKRSFCERHGRNSMPEKSIRPREPDKEQHLPKNSRSVASRLQSCLSVRLFWSRAKIRWGTLGRRSNSEVLENRP